MEMEWCEASVISVVEMGRGSLRGDVAMGTGDLPFLLPCSIWSPSVGTGHAWDVSLPWGGAIPGVRAAEDGVSHAES